MGKKRFLRKVLFILLKQQKDYGDLASIDDLLALILKEFK